MKKLFALILVAGLSWYPLQAQQVTNNPVAAAPTGSAAGGDLLGTYPSTVTVTGMQRVLGSLRSANFNTTADQPIAIVSTIAAFELTSVLVTNCSTSLTTAAGGFYTAASKGGTVLVLAATTYSALTGSTVISPLTVVAAQVPVRRTLTQIYFALTLGQGSAATCDIYLLGNDLT
jgi:hypothetical protein